MQSAAPSGSHKEDVLSQRQENPWRWLARELHDGPTQDMWYIQAQLASLAEQLHDDRPEVRAQIEGLRRVAQDAYKGLRMTLGLIKSCKPAYIDLVRELESVAQKFSSSLGMEIDVKTSPGRLEVPVYEKVGHHVRLLVQETLWNTWRHGKTKTAVMEIKHSEMGLAVSVSDNGCGFDQIDKNEGHYGLENMKERAELIKGKLYVTSSLGGGTCVTLHIPPDGIVKCE